MKLKFNKVTRNCIKYYVFYCVNINRRSVTRKVSQFRIIRQFLFCQAFRDPFKVHNISQISGVTPQLWMTLTTAQLEPTQMACYGPSNHLQH